METRKDKKNKRRSSIPEPTVKQFPQIHSAVHLKGIDSEKMAPTFSFYHLDDRVECPSCWQQAETKALYKMFSTASSITWTQVRTHSGLRYKKTNAALCKKSLNNLSEDLSLSELRVSEKARVFGVRKDHIFYVIWFDRNHQVLPE